MACCADQYLCWVGLLAGGGMAGGNNRGFSGFFHWWWSYVASAMAEYPRRSPKGLCAGLGWLFSYLVCSGNIHHLRCFYRLVVRLGVIHNSYFDWCRQQRKPRFTWGAPTWISLSFLSILVDLSIGFIKSKKIKYWKGRTMGFKNFWAELSWRVRIFFILSAIVSGYMVWIIYSDYNQSTTRSLFWGLGLPLGSLLAYWVIIGSIWLMEKGAMTRVGGWLVEKAATLMQAVFALWVVLTSVCVWTGVFSKDSFPSLQYVIVGIGSVLVWAGLVALKRWRDKERKNRYVRSLRPA